MKKTIKMIVLGFSICLIMTQVCSAKQYLSCGSFKSVSGDVIILRQNNETIKAQAGTQIFPKDQIQSGKQASASLILQDDTIICLGPESTMNMDEFIFNPSVYEYSMATRLLKGSFLFLSGMIAKLAPDHVNIQTPDGTIAVRGTRFLVEVNN